MTKHPVLVEVTERIIERSRVQRTAYLNRVKAATRQGKVERTQLACANLAHAFAAMPGETKIRIKEAIRPNLAIVSSYNDMLSAHQPFNAFPDWLKEEALAAGASAQFAGGVPAMCDGVTQGLPGMELSLFSRDIIAMSTAIALAHQMFDAALYLGVCDKIIPGLVIGAVAFGHLPGVFVPAGPMPSGISNDEKTKTRQLFAAGKVGNDALLESESRSYHSPGTCTFYGTANSNQMLMEVLGLHLPGSAFIPPGTPLREALTREAARQAVRISAQGEQFTPIADIIDEKSLVNAIVGLLATGGSTNHTMHLVAIGRAAGINLNWDDYDALSRVVPLLARVYPNGPADINHFHAAGGIGYVIRQLLDAGLLHEDVKTVMGPGLRQYTREPSLDDKGQLVWNEATLEPRNPEVLRPTSNPFSADGGLKVLSGNIGRSVIKISSIKPEYRHIEAPAIVFNDQNELQEAFKRGELEKDFIAVVRYQGPRACGMPELHRLTPPLGVLLEKGFKVALVTDGRMSGASGKIPAAIHVSPEAASGGPIALVQTGDMMRLDIETGALDVIVDAEEWAARKPADVDLSANTYGVGRELFAGFRAIATTAEEGATSFALPQWENK